MTERVFEFWADGWKREVVLAAKGREKLELLDVRVCESIELFVQFDMDRYLEKVLVLEGGEEGGVSGKYESVSPCEEDLEDDFVDIESIDPLGLYGVMNEGERYVIPIAVWSPVRSRFALMNAIVASPGTASGVIPGISIRTTDSDCFSENTGSA